MIELRRRLIQSQIKTLIIVDALQKQLSNPKGISKPYGLEIVRINRQKRDIRTADSLL